MPPKKQKQVMKPVKAWSVIFAEEFNFNDTLVSWIFNTEEKARGFLSQQKGIIIPVLISPLPPHPKKKVTK